MIVTLIGYRGCGKSSVAPMIADALKCEWVDSDREIERLAGKTIAQIFAEHGEQHFRDLESQVLNQLSQSSGSFVIAAGGGAILRESNRKLLKAAGPVVWLTAEVSVLAERILGDGQTAANRPSLTGTDVVQEIRDVLEARLPLYQDAATFTVATDNRSVEDICHAALSAIERWNGEMMQKVSS
ncbi:UNVERIFIED_CONTAM: hypothetical protein GTU68_055045 [Idotea baltica]|nr:hypothetical protein [Idotea baltica]